MNHLHLGRGTTRGAMTVFPLWSTATGWGRYTMDHRHLGVREVEDGPDVGTLMVGNTGDRPLLVLEGQLFEGGWQHRMATRSVLVGVHQRIPVDVACVEEGRWGGSCRQHSRGRRATPYVRDAVRGGGDVQGTVWRRVAEHTAGTHNATGSLVSHVDALDIDTADFEVLAGQVGVLVGIGGQPYRGGVRLRHDPATRVPGHRRGCGHRCPIRPGSPHAGASCSPVRRPCRLPDARGRR